MITSRVTTKAVREVTIARFVQNEFVHVGTGGSEESQAHR